jgi:bifunctional enzyme CysN/CysC
MPAEILRVLTCGSVDDGKSTLLGRLLLDLEAVPADVRAQVERDSRKYGTVEDGGLDPSLLLDGLEAEREQGITIDVAYRFVTTAQRRIVFADAPGHAQYTANMATAAAGADLALLLVDVRHGVIEQTRRHAAIAAMMGVAGLVVAVNKMDLVGFEEGAFRAIEKETTDMAAALGFDRAVVIPLSARSGANVTRAAHEAPWYGGSTLAETLDAPVSRPTQGNGVFRFPVQWVNRAIAERRGLAGTVASGSVKRGDAVVVSPSGRGATVARIIGLDGDKNAAVAGESITLVLDEHVDVGRGDLLSHPTDRPLSGRSIVARVLWAQDSALAAGRRLLVKIGPRWASATLRTVSERLDLASMQDGPAAALQFGDVGRVVLDLLSEVAFDAFATARETGAFALVDPSSSDTVGVGLVEGAQRVATNVYRQAFDVDREARSALKGQTPMTVWFTGLPSSGKSTLANALEAALASLGRHTYLLDGDNLRHGLNKDLGFSEDDRTENIRRAAEVARLMNDAGLLVLGAFVSPLQVNRDLARNIVGADNFLEVFVDAPIAVCIERDAKGLLAKAQRGEILGVTGVNAPYERPAAADLVLRTDAVSIEQSVMSLLALLRERGAIG